MKKEEMKKEALARMEILQLRKDVLEAFDNEDKTFASFVGVPFELEEGQKKRVRKFEEETGSVVYHIIQNYTDLGEMLTFLYVSKYEEEWEGDMEDLKCGTPIAYVVNIEVDMFSEFGSVGVEPCLPGGGVIRTA